MEKLKVIMDNWKFVINKLILFIGMIGAFMGATFGYYDILVVILEPSGFAALLAFEAVWLAGFSLMLAIVFIDMTKDLRKERK